MLAHAGRRSRHLSSRVQQTSGHRPYAELLRRLAAGERFGQTQRHKGRLYQVKQRGLRHEREVERRLQSGLLRGLGLEARVKWFPSNSGTVGPSR